MPKYSGFSRGYTTGSKLQKKVTKIADTGNTDFT